MPARKVPLPADAPVPGGAPTSRAWVAAALVSFTAALGLYAATLAPTTALVDSGELIVAARGLGVAHPPGFPLYTLLAHLATCVPFGNVAQRVNALSAPSAALAAGILTLAVGEALAAAPLAAAVRVRAKKKAKGKAARELAAQSPAPLARLPESIGPLCGLAAGLAFAASRTLWSYATLAEVYALNMVLLATAWYGALAWRRRRLAALLSPGEAGIHEKWARRGLTTAAVAFGLALAVHHATVLLTLPALLFLAWRTPGARPREIARAALLALGVAALAYLYLPIAASRHPALNWGDPSSLARLWRHVSGRQYQVYLAIGPDDLGAQVREIAGYVGREFGPPWLPVALALAALGLLAAWRTDRGFALALGAIGAADLGLSLIYDIAEDQDAYLLPLFFALALALGLGIATLIGRLPAGRRARFAAPALALLPAAIAFAANLPYDDRHRDRLAEQYVEDALHVVAPGSLILTLDWQLYSPMRYFQDIEGHRRDVLAIDLNLLRRSWYLADLRRAAPAVLAEVRPEADAYLVDLLAWEADPQRFGSDPARVGRLSQRYRTLVTALAERQLRHGRLYATHDLISGAPENDPEAHQALGSYQAVPRGILFELTRGPEVRPLAPLRLAALPSLFGGVRRFAPDDVVEKKILPVYVDAFLFQATYLAGNHLPDQALATLDQGLAAIPEGNPTRDLLARRRGEIAGSATLPP